MPTPNFRCTYIRVLDPRKRKKPHASFMMWKEKRQKKKKKKVFLARYRMKIWSGGRTCPVYSCPREQQQAAGPHSFEYRGFCVFSFLALDDGSSGRKSLTCACHACICCCCCLCGSKPGNLVPSYLVERRDPFLVILMALLSGISFDGLALCGFVVGSW